MHATKNHFEKSTSHARLFVKPSLSSMKRARDTDELTLELCINGNKDNTIDEQSTFLQQAREATQVKCLVLKNEIKNFSYWPMDSRVLDLSQHDVCEKLIIQNSFFPIIPPPNLETLEYTGNCNGDLPDKVLPNLKRLAVTVELCLPQTEFLLSHYPNLEVLEIHEIKEGLMFNELVEDVKNMKTIDLKNLQKISVVHGKKRFDFPIIKKSADILLKEWLQKDAKLARELKTIVNFETYIDDHDKNVDKINKLLVVQYQKLKNGVWVSIDSWCCPFPTRNKNCLCLQKDGKLHLSLWSIGRNIELSQQMILCNNRVLIQEGATERDYNLMFTREQLSKCLHKEKCVEPTYDELKYERAVREWHKGFEDPDISCCETRAECVDTMFEWYGNDCNHWFFLCPELSLLTERTDEINARSTLMSILKELEFDVKKHKDLGKRFTFVGWKTNQQEDQEHQEYIESKKAQGPNLEFNLLNRGNVYESNLSIWTLYYNTPFSGSLPCRLGMATFETYQNADLPGLFEKEPTLLYKSFSQYRYDAAVYLLSMMAIPTNTKKFQVDKDQDLWAEHWFWHILKDDYAYLRDALLETNDAKLWFDGYRCIGLENVRRKLSLFNQAKKESKKESDIRKVTALQH